MSGGPEERARRYVGWVARHSLAIIAAHAAVLAAAIYLVAFRLPLFADFSYLLPQDAPAVRDLRRVEARVKATDTVLVVIEAPSSEARDRAEQRMAAGIRALPATLVEQVGQDDRATREFLLAHKDLFVPLADLETAYDALKRRIAEAKLAANPLYVDLDDHAAANTADQRRLDDLRKKRTTAEARLARPSNLSADGRIAMIQVHIAFPSTDVGSGEELVARLAEIRDGVIAENPAVRIGFTGGNITSLAEHSAITKGMLLSSIVTTVLVALVLALYFRSARLLVLLVTTLVTATATAFGAAAFTVGHLNAATAFLGAIIAGNGVNYGILLIARYLEERKRLAAEPALARAIVGTLKPTGVASLGAAIAYGSLAATSFKGFADFAVIGAVGMLLCWIATFLLLPALLLRWGRTVRASTKQPVVGSWLVRLIGFRRSGVVCAMAAAVTLGAGAIVWQYIAADPFEYDLKRLRSEGDDAVEARTWMQLSDKTFGRGFAGRTFIAADRAEQIPLIVAALQARDPAQAVIGPVASILQVVPEQQPEKLALLAKIRALLDEDALDALADKERSELLALRPAAHLEAISAASLPAEIRDQLTEKDGRIGFLVSIDTADALDEWNGQDLIKFATAVRRLDLPNHDVITTSGASVIFADIIDVIERDGPIVTLIAAGCLTLMVVVLVGWNRRGAAVLVATAMGSLLMVATCALLGLKVNFLDFVALPITLGLGIDYAINIAHRHDSEEHPDPLVTLRTSGSAVFVCSLTTIIGYGSLLVSDNLAIRGFGTASLIGEVTCVLTALIVVPALLALGGRALIAKLA